MNKLLLLPLCLLLLTGCSYFSGEAQELLLEGDIEHTIVATTSTVAGQIIELHKGLGETVKKDEVIAVIDHQSADYTIQQLEATLKLKQAALDKLLQGARPEQVKQAQATVRVVEARLAEIQSSTRPEQIEQAKTRVTAAQARLDLAQSGSRKEQIEQEKNRVLIAKEAYNTQLISYGQLHKTYERTQALVTDGLAPQKELDAAKTQLDLASKQLTTLQLQLDNANQQLALLQNSTIAEEVVIAQANYEEAQAQLALIQKGASAQTIAVVQAELDAAKAQLALVSNGATEQEIAMAQAEIEAAQAQLDSAKHQLTRHFIRALADGRIISKSVELGNVVVAGSHIADIASSTLAVTIYVPTEYIHTIQYDQLLNVQTPTEALQGKVSYIALEDEYMPKDKQTGIEDKPIATKVKLTLQGDRSRLNPSTPVTVTVPLP